MSADTEREAREWLARLAADNPTSAVSHTDVEADQVARALKQRADELEAALPQLDERFTAAVLEALRSNEPTEALNPTHDAHATRSERAVNGPATSRFKTSAAPSKPSAVATVRDAIASFLATFYRYASAPLPVAAMSLAILLLAGTTAYEVTQNREKTFSDEFAQVRGSSAELKHQAVSDNGEATARRFEVSKEILIESANPVALEQNIIQAAIEAKLKVEIDASTGDPIILIGPLQRGRDDQITLRALIGASGELEGFVAVRVTHVMR
jgi:hypothetical protein